MYGDFILWFRYKMRNRIGFKGFARNMRWRWFVFKRQNFECVHDYGVMKADLYLGTLYGCKKCGKRKTTKRSIYKEE